MTTRSATSWTRSVVRWFDSWAEDERDADTDPRSFDLLRVVPFLLLHATVLLIPVVGWSWTAIWVAVGFYFVRMFAITAFYHRYFSHRAFETSRVMQFLFAVLGSSAIQRGPLWWASHHRAHHRYSDAKGDAHSPVREGFLYSHVGWVLAHENYRTRQHLVPDLAQYPELRFLDRFDILVPLLLVPAFYGLGAALEAWAPGLGTNGMQMLVIGLCISTVVLYHCTFTINSLAHRFGTRRYKTKDDSRNNFWLSLLTLGEGWHNNHHFFPAAARQGFRWWEIDISYYVLKAMDALGLVWNLRPVPARVVSRDDRLRPEGADFGGER